MLISEIPTAPEITEALQSFSAYLIKLPPQPDIISSITTTTTHPPQLNPLPFFFHTEVTPVATTQKMMNRSMLRLARSVRTGPGAIVAGRRHASSAVFNWEDPLAAAELYTEEELAIQDTARQYCQEQLQPRVLGTNPPFFHSFLHPYMRK